MHYIYVIRNTLNGKRYVGQTENLKNRWKRHKSDARMKNPPLIVSRALKKYQIINFSFTPIETWQTQKEVDIAEEFWIGLLDTRNPIKGYNIRTGGNKSPMTEETKRKLSKARKGKHFSPATEFKAGHIPWLKGTNIRTSSSFDAGSKHKMAKLTEEQVLEIVKLAQSGMRRQEIADHFDMKINAIYAILQGRTWSHLTDIQYDPRPKKKISWPEPKELLEMINKIGVVKVARQLNCTHGAVRKFLKRRKFI